MVSLIALEHELFFHDFQFSCLCVLSQVPLNPPFSGLSSFSSTTSSSPILASSLLSLCSVHDAPFCLRSCFLSSPTMYSCAGCVQQPVRADNPACTGLAWAGSSVCGLVSLFPETSLYPPTSLNPAHHGALPAPCRPCAPEIEDGVLLM